MKELSLHILDIVQNSITANATIIEIIITESIKDDLLKIRITDNGCGMSEELVKKVISPFTTTRTTRKVGLGISLFKAAAERCNGSFFIDSVVGEGTTIETSFQRSHIDRAPLGNMADTFAVLLSSKEGIDFIYKHSLDGDEFTVDTREIRKILGEEVSLLDYKVMEWIKGYITESLNNLYKT